MKALLIVFIIAVSLAYCTAHFSGESHERFAPCNSTSCLNNGTCKWRKCYCQKNYYGASCQQFDFCSTNPCSYPFKCANVNVTSYNCSCPRGYTLNATINNCTAIDYCAQNPCQNNGTCANAAVVLFKPTSYSCNCTAGYHGKNCEYKNYCSANPTICQNGGRCEPVRNDYRCDCPRRYSGKNCEKKLWWPWG